MIAFFCFVVSSILVITYLVVHARWVEASYDRAGVLKRSQAALELYSELTNQGRSNSFHNCHGIAKTVIAERGQALMGRADLDTFRYLESSTRWLENSLASLVEERKYVK